VGAGHGDPLRARENAVTLPESGPANQPYIRFLTQPGNPTPWRIARDPAAYTACYVGISFYRALDGSALHTSVAQVFDERGDGIIVRGGTAQIAKEDRQSHLDAEGAERLLADALARYRAEHKTLPARVVLHKSSTFSADELAGFAAAADAQGIELLDLVSLGNAYTRLFRDGAYPPLRGTLLSLDARTHVFTLATASTSSPPIQGCMCRAPS